MGKLGQATDDKTHSLVDQPRILLLVTLARKQALRDVLEDVEAVKYTHEDDWGNAVISKVELTAKIKARLDKA